jgi:phosphohistidine phosphatase
MRRLMLLRHAKSDWSSAGMPDRERPLNKRGRETVPKVAKFIVSAGLLPDSIISSTALRTRQTCDLIAAALPPSTKVGFEDRLYEADAETILAVIRATPDDSHCVLLIGHNPGLQETALMLVSSGDERARSRMREKFPTAGLAVIDFSIDRWAKLKFGRGRLDRFVTPKQFGQGD